MGDVLRLKKEMVPTGQVPGHPQTNVAYGININLVIIISIIVFFLLLVLVGIFFVSSEDSKKKRQESPQLFAFL